MSEHILGIHALIKDLYQQLNDISDEWDTMIEYPLANERSHHVSEERQKLMRDEMKYLRTRISNLELALQEKLSEHPSIEVECPKCKKKVSLVYYPSIYDDLDNFIADVQKALVDFHEVQDNARELKIPIDLTITLIILAFYLKSKKDDN